MDKLPEYIHNESDHDFVKVVRCQNCSEYDPDAEWCNIWEQYLQPYFFCACGKRRSDNG